MAEYTDNIVVNLPELYTIAGAQTDVDAATKALDQATAVIELVSGVVFDAEFREIPVSKSDALWVRRAVVFQAAWILSNEESLSHLSATSISQEGLRIDVEDDLSWVLAPLAKRSLQNCSFNQNRTQRVSSRRRARPFDYTVDDNHAWETI